MTLVTIGIPAYNQQEYLPDAIESALAQTYKDIEVIVVVDGSTDNSLEIAKKYEPKIKIINQVNKGLASARNTAIMNMRGQYFLPLDADDILEENCVQELVRVAKNTNADIIAPSFHTFGMAQEVVTLMASPSLDDFRTGNRIGYFSMIKRGALQEVGGYSPKMVEGYEDMHLWINLLTRGKKIETVPQPLVLYRTKDKSMWHESVKHHKELMEQIYKDFPEFLPVELPTI
jgi:glycosyltransferase involved in cell wall biosynthesis